MQTIRDRSFDTLVEQFLGIPLSQQTAKTICMSKQRPDTRDFILRALTLMKRAGYSAANFSPHLIRWLSSTIPNILPGAWGGRIPPLTAPARHGKLDDYVADQTIASGIGNDSGTHGFIDIGCGFPPLTTVDTARKLKDWHIHGVDRSFADFVVYDSKGHYACFDQQGEYQYFQGMMNAGGRALYADPIGARKHFEEIFLLLFPLLKGNKDGASDTVERYGCKLIHNYIRDFEKDNLTFIESDISDLKLYPAKVVRCMNVLIYFKPEIRKEMLMAPGRILDADGLLITGTNGLGLELRYTIYQKGLGGIVPKEFAFSLDNLGHITFVPWLTMHENDPEAMLLAKLAGTIRDDRSFRQDFNHQQDTLLKHYDICQRGADGYLQFPEEEMCLTEYIQKNARIWQRLEEEGYTNRAVESLKKAGFNAWKNSVGDIAIQPPEEFFL